MNRIGGFFGGNRINVTPAISFRYKDKITSEISLSHNNVKLPGGKFSTNLIRARLTYSFTPKMYVQSLVQYNSRPAIILN